MRAAYLVLAIYIGGFAAAQTNRSLSDLALSSPPVIDGVIAEGEWAEAKIADGFVDIFSGAATPYATRFHVGTTADALWIAAVCTDPNPSGLQATEYRRDASLEGNDRIIVYLNLFNSHSEQDANEFEIGAGGGMTAEFAGGRASKREWQGEWDAKAKITADGYIIEVRIPWRILASPGGGVRDIEVNFGRYISRTQQAVLWSNIGPDERLERNGTLQDVTLPTPEAASQLSLLPYQVVGYDGERDSHVFDTGFDVRYQVGTRATLLGTVNPDFRNLENAILGLSVSRFERLADERRPFFVEGGDYFGLGGMSVRLLAPQRIGAFDAGAKFFGKLSDADVLSALATVRFDHETNAVVRYRRTWDARSSLTAGVASHDDSAAGISNLAAHVDLTLGGPRWSFDTYLSASTDSEAGSGNRMDFDANYSDGIVSGHVGWQQISSDFLPRIGFAPRRGFEGWNGRISYERQFATGPMIEFDAGFFAMLTEREGSGGTYLDLFEGEMGVDLRNGLSVGVGATYLNFLGARDEIIGIGIAYPNNDPYRSIEVGVNVGRIEGDGYRSIEVGGNYRFASRLSLGASAEFSWLGDEFEEQHVLAASYEISSFQSIAGRAVYQDGELNWYLSFRHSGNLGAEYYVILGNPNSDSFASRLVLKAVFPFEIRF
jgi:hypothetical protein